MLIIYFLLVIENNRFGQQRAISSEGGENLVDKGKVEYDLISIVHSLNK